MKIKLTRRCEYSSLFHETLILTEGLVVEVHSGPHSDGSVSLRATNTLGHRINVPRNFYEEVEA